jgi:hypothetical protein
VYARAEPGTFEWLADLPPDVPGLVGGPSLLATGSGELLLVNGNGIWRLPAGETVFVPDEPGPPGSGVWPTAIAFGPDGTAVVGAGRRFDSSAPAVVLLRAPGADRWVEVASGARPADPIRHLFVEDGGTLLAVTDFDVRRIAADGATSERLPTDGIPEDARLAAFAVDAAGTQYALAGNGLYRLEVGETSCWEPVLPDRAVGSFALEPDGTVWIGIRSVGGPFQAYRVPPGADRAEPVGVGPVHDPHFYPEKIAVDGRGTVWATSYDGILRLDDGVWRQVGSGPCSCRIVALQLGEDGEAACVDENHLYLLDPQTDDWVRVAEPLHIGRGSWLGDGPTAVVTAPDGHLWLALREGGVFEVRSP